MPSAAAAQQRILRLAAATPVHRAFHWLHLHEPQMRQWQLEVLGIPAPPFGEAPRAAWFLDRFQQLGLSNAHLDAEGNALAELAPEDAAADAPCILLSAHLDTVFPAGTPSAPVEDGSRILCPGACDNAAGLTAMLGLAAAFRFAGIIPPIPILFAANVGEEGEGDLRGMRHLFLRGPYGPRIRAAIALEGSGNSSVVTRGLGSRRYRVTVTGPGGHSWADAGAPNPILILSKALTGLAALHLPDAPRTVLNVGQIAGGTSVNSIPESAAALLDLRSTETSQILALEARIHDIFSPPQFSIKIIGDRPAAELSEDSELLASLKATDRHLNLPTTPHHASTDANLPLSLGIPAMAVGAGGQGGGIHTLQEWYDPTGREIALRRVLLILMDLVQVTPIPVDTF
jgi:tripeptide aminopeptidase